MFIEKFAAAIKPYVVGGYRPSNSDGLRCGRVDLLEVPDKRVDRLLFSEIGLGNVRRSAIATCFIASGTLSATAVLRIYSIRGLVTINARFVA